jgi:hypothetical protein
MKRHMITSLLAVLCAVGPAVANAERDGTVNERQFRLEQRIEHGWRSGELTRGEYRRLQRELREIDYVARVSRSDGYLSPRERRELHARLDALAREVHRQRRDGDFRHGDWRPRPYNHAYPVHRGY